MQTEGTYRLTPQRRAVLEAVQETDEHLTAREILERARVKQATLSYATVYNALDYLARAGLVHEIRFGSGASRYDRRPLSHGHAVCEECGRVSDVALPAGEGLLREAAAASGFAPTVITVVLYGRCGDCRR